MNSKLPASDQTSRERNFLGEIPFRSETLEGITVDGYSRAAVQSFWRIPEMKLGFDLGAQPWEFAGTPNWFITHCHLDHVAALPAYLARRRMMKMEPPTVYAPASNVPNLELMLKAVTRLDRGRLPCQLVPVEPGDEIELSRELVVTVGATQHTVPSVSYLVWERRKKLKPEFLGLPGDKIRDLRLSGADVTEERRLPLVGYLGDTAPSGLDNCPAMYDAKILIAEMTFVAPGHKREKIHKHGHMHLDDFIVRKDNFRNGKILACHFSTRYRPRQIERAVKKAIPDMLGGRLVLWL